MVELCPCGHQQRRFELCCQPYLEGTKAAPTAEALMRSRYSAYALGGYGQYLMDTWHPATVATLTAAQLNQRDSEWLSLQVLQAQQQGDQASVEFVATYREANSLQQLHEVSAFTRVNQRWLYLGGEVSNQKLALGRNDPCACGSGKKYKRCCLAI